VSDEQRVSATRAGLPVSHEWSDRAVVVTGASGGIGKGIVGALLEAGAKVVLSDIDSDGLAAVAKSFQGPSERLAIFAADIGEESHVNALSEHALERFGRLYGWVNNAGTVELSPALQTTRASFVGQLNTNVVALFQCCQAAARAIGTAGAIVNVASNAGKVGFPDMVGYNASKAAVINLTRNLAEEWASSGINVNAVCPGSVSTPMLRRVAEYVAGKNDLDTDEVLAGFISHQLGRAIDPLEVGRVVVFLLSDAAKIIRGQAVNVDAGDTPY
jgi:NAD(P)-dependent dehydrogenase (short-subunit alcohol dehydrogenase family)